MHFGVDRMMDRSVVEHDDGRTVIALRGDLVEKFDDGIAFDRRTRHMVSQRVGREVEHAERRQWKRGSTQCGRPRGDHALCTGGEAAKPV